MRPRHQHIHGAKPPVGRKHLDHSGERGLAPSPEPIVVITCIIASSESWGPYQRPHPWHSRAGGGAVHSINSRHSTVPLIVCLGPLIAKSLTFSTDRRLFNSRSMRRARSVMAGELLSLVLGFVIGGDAGAERIRRIV